ncbi:MAG: hypothetical protein IT165_25320 [Bryobacterales bacterium]|nr:hypothetical protein [Bryobacterales bacterium]
MRSLPLNPTSETLFPSGACNPYPDWNAPLANGIYALWLPTREPRMWFNPFRLTARRETIPFEYSSAYFHRRLLTAAQPSGASGLGILPGLGGNFPTPFGAALACSNEQLGWNGSSLGDAPAFLGGSGKAISVCVWFRINRLNGTGFPTVCSTSYTTGWWVGLRTSTGKYKCIFRNSSSPYGPFEWGSYGGDFRKLNCISFVLPMDANGTATVYHNGVQVVQATISNASSASGSASVFPLSSSTPGMFVEIFGVASWTRALYPEEMRQLVPGPRVLLAKRQAFWYGPLLASVAAQIAGGSTLTSDRQIGRSRTALIQGNSSQSATRHIGFSRTALISSASTLAAARHGGYSRTALISGASSITARAFPNPSPLRKWLVRPESRSFVVPAESRTLFVRPEKRRVDG